MNKITLARLYGYLLGDGWLSKNGSCGFSGQPEDLLEIKRDILSVFGEESGVMTLRTRDTSSEKYGINGTSSEICVSGPAYDHFNKMGHPIGKKVEDEYILPEWLMNSSLDEKAAFLSGLMGAEGYTPAMQQNGKTPKVVGLTLTKRYRNKDSLLVISKQLQDLFSDLGVETNIKFKETHTVDKNIRLDLIIVNNRDNLIQFLSEIGYAYCKNKEQKAQILLHYLLQKREQIIKLENIREVILSKDDTAKNLSNLYGVSINQIENWRRGRKVRITNNYPTLNLNI